MWKYRAFWRGYKSISFKSYLDLFFIFKWWFSIALILKLVSNCVFFISSFTFSLFSSLLFCFISTRFNHHIHGFLLSNGQNMCCSKMGMKLISWSTYFVRISILTMVKYIVYLSLSQPHKMMGSRRKYCAGRKDSPRGNPKAKRSYLGKGSVELAKLVIQRQ